MCILSIFFIINFAHTLYMLQVLFTLQQMRDSWALFMRKAAS